MKQEDFSSPTVASAVPGATASTRVVPAAPGGRRWLMLGVAAVVLVAAGVGVAGRFKPAKKADAPAPPLQFGAAEVTRPVRMALPLTIEFSGPLVAPGTAIVKAKANGTLLSLNVNEGSRVKAGEVLGRIDLSDLQTRVLDRSAAVESAEATLAEAQRQHEANVNLAHENFISGTALQSSQARLDAARAQVKSMQAQLDGIRIGVRDAGLVSPISGIVGKRHVLPGEKVNAEQSLLTIVDLSQLELVGTVGTNEVSQLAAGQPVQVRVEGQASTETGRIDRIAPAAEPGTRAIGVVVRLSNKDERLRAGQYAQASVVLDDRQERLTVPITAVSQVSGQDQVWTIERGALVRRIVITGRRDPVNGRIEVLKGVPDDATVLAVRFDNLKEGVLAQVRTDAATASGVTPSAAAASGV